jgi:hypothetical protein
MKQFKYITHGFLDGLGAQHTRLQQLGVFAKMFGLKVIFDLRTMPNFLGMDFDNGIKNEMFSFDSSIIHEPDIIDSLDADAIFTFNNRHIDRKNSNRFLLDVTENFIGQHKLYIKPKNMDLLEKYKPRVVKSVAVHARLGNGEDPLGVEGMDHWKIGHDSFIREMQKHSQNFFVCTDSPDFLERCRQEFGSRIFYTDRIMPKQGEGPGHRSNEYITRLENSYITLRDALVDMILLGDATHLICNYSGLNQYAGSKLSSTILHQDLEK